MQLERNDNQKTLTLPQDLHWQDEFDWLALAQTSPEYTLSGAVIIEQGTKLSGRPITLGGTWVWLARETLLTLQEWAEIPELTLTLTHNDGRRFNVCFSRPALSNITPVAYRAPEEMEAQYEGLQLHFITI